MAVSVISPLLAKRAIKKTAGLASVLLQGTTPARTSRSACVLVYHRVADVRVAESRLDDWNVAPARLEQQIASLADRVEFVFVRDLHDRLVSGDAGDRPLVCLTFDDGFQNFHDVVLPILQRYQARATAFVVTSVVGSAQPMPFDRWGSKHVKDAPAVTWRPLDWASIERCADSGLVEIGGHSHRHLNAAEAPEAEVVDEAGRCRMRLRQYLGSDHAVSYAFPYGSTRLGHVTPAYVASVKSAGFTTAVTTDLGLADATSDRFALPRVEAYRSDSPAVVHAKVRGSLAPLYFTDQLRRRTR